jgi:GTP cyclohydrolase I
MSKIILNEQDKQSLDSVLERVDEVSLNAHTKRYLATQLLLESVGENIKREGLLDTPARVAGMYEEIFAGYQIDPKSLLETTFQDEAHQEMVIVRDIPFYSHCEHHMVTFFGKVDVAYIPRGKVVGISKIARLVDCFGKRFQIQERMTSQIADTLDEVLQPRGVAVIIEAEHLCMTMRGVQKSGAITVTSGMRGAFLEPNNDARIEFLSLRK